MSSSSFPLLLCFLLLLSLAVSTLSSHSVIDVRTADASEQWGYVEVRPKAHMFWWLYRSPNRVDEGPKPWPTVLWLQGGPGASGTGLGNFQEIGPLDTDLKPRNTTWLQKADLLFVDNPVGTGYSFVEDSSALVKTDEEAATDLTALLKALYNSNEKLQASPLYVVAESYGGKFAVTLGLSIVNAIKARQLSLTFGGVVLGDTWISPEDFVFSWGPLLRDVSRLDINGAEQANSLAERIKQQLASGRYAEATNTWMVLEYAIFANSNQVDFYNFLLDADQDPLATTTSSALAMGASLTRYSRYLSSKVSSNSGNITELMNGIIRNKLKMIPENVSWVEQSDLVFDAQWRFHEVDQLLAMGVNVSIYSGQLDVICATKGTEAWVQKLKWAGLKNFTNLKRSPLYCEENGTITKGFFKSYQNLHFYWILGAGHFVPAENPCAALKMLGEITQSPAATAVSSS